jgi:hypothetical protein
MASQGQDRNMSVELIRLEEPEERTKSSVDGEA